MAIWVPSLCKELSAFSIMTAEFCWYVQCIQECFILFYFLNQALLSVSTVASHFDTFTGERACTICYIPVLIWGYSFDL